MKGFFKAREMDSDRWDYGWYIPNHNPKHDWGWMVSPNYESHTELIGNPVEDLTDCTPVDPETLCRIIGIADSTGQDVYEGDITSTGAVMVWCDKLLCWCFEHNNDGILTPLFHDKEGMDKMVIVGNIHDK
jgi:hypothetical protein